MKTALFFYAGLLMLLFILAWSLVECWKHQKARLALTKGKAYQILLQNGDKRIVFILTKPKYRCQISGDASDHWMDKTDIAMAACNQQLVILLSGDPHTLWVKGAGYLRDEGTMFDVYRGLRNPIVSLKLIVK